MNNNYIRSASFDRIRHFFFIFFIVTALPAVSLAQNSADIEWLIDVLGLEEGSVVADIGAGDGDQTLALVRHVSPGGHIYSSELGSESLQDLQEAVRSAPAYSDNITVIEGHPKQTNLTEECCDALFLRRVYHHFTDPETMNKSLWQSLKPGGRLAVIDFEPRESESRDPEGRDRGGQHGVTAETVIKELNEAGFKLIKNEKSSGRNIYVVVEKPVDD